MTGLSEIKFYQVYKRGKRKSKPRIWVRKVTKTTMFEQKAKIIKMNAEIINQKLQNY